MANINAYQLIKQLKQEANLYRLDNNIRSRSIWFSTQIPSELPIGSKSQPIAVENIAPLNLRYMTITNELSGWMTYRQYLGPRYVAATAFITVSPLNSGKPNVEIELLEISKNLITDGSSQQIYGFEYENYIEYLCKGLVSGLIVPIIDSPISDIKIRILGGISDRVESVPNAFERLGLWLMQAMIFEMDQRGWIQVP